jgi:hypothetical protein
MFSILPDGYHYVDSIGEHVVPEINALIGEFPDPVPYSYVSTGSSEVEKSMEQFLVNRIDQLVFDDGVEEQERETLVDCTKEAVAQSLLEMDALVHIAANSESVLSKSSIEKQSEGYSQSLFSRLVWLAPSYKASVYHGEIVPGTEHFYGMNRGKSSKSLRKSDAVIPLWDKVFDGLDGVIMEFKPYKANDLSYYADLEKLRRMSINAVKRIHDTFEIKSSKDKLRTMVFAVHGRGSEIDIYATYMRFDNIYVMKRVHSKTLNFCSGSLQGDEYRKQLRTIFEVFNSVLQFLYLQRIRLGKTEIREPSPDGAHSLLNTISTPLNNDGKGKSREVNNRDGGGSGSDTNINVQGSGTAYEMSDDGAGPYVYAYNGYYRPKPPAPYEKCAVMCGVRYRRGSDGRGKEPENVVFKHIVETLDFRNEYCMYRLCALSKVPYVGMILESGTIEQYFPDYFTWMFEGKHTLVLPRYSSFPSFLSPEQYLRVFSQLLEFLCAMETHGFVHLDLRPENIMWNDVREEIVVIDFEMGRVLDSHGCCVVGEDDKVGGEPIIAPEMEVELEEVGKHACSALTDVFSAGVTLELWREEHLDEEGRLAVTAYTDVIRAMCSSSTKRISASKAMQQFQAIGEKAKLLSLPGNTCISDKENDVGTPKRPKTMQKMTSPHRSHGLQEQSETIRNRLRV